MLDATIAILEANRAKTLATLDRALELGDATTVLGWRPEANRAHVGWQLMHIAVTEEKFGFARLHGADCPHPELIEAYGHGSTPSDVAPSVEDIRSLLSSTRADLIEAVRKLDGVDLDERPDSMSDRGWSYNDALRLLVWHEAHHQGQSHITLNLYEAARS